MDHDTFFPKLEEVAIRYDGIDDEEMTNLVLQAVLFYQNELDEFSKVSANETIDSDSYDNKTAMARNSESNAVKKTCTDQKGARAKKEAWHS